jgi:hypothetical protein
VIASSGIRRTRNDEFLGFLAGRSGGAAFFCASDRHARTKIGVKQLVADHG